MISYPNAKVNIGLRVIRRREDGFHELETVFCHTDLCDVLEVLPTSAQDSDILFRQYGINLGGDPMDNLCVKAARLLMSEFDLPPVEINLHKRIPAGAGLGGGSADATFTLRAMDKIFGLNLGSEGIARRAAALGSDCPFFAYDTPMLGTGRGEILSPIEIPTMKGYEIRLLLPPVFVSTADAYRGIVPRERWSAAQRASAGEKSPADAALPLAELLHRPVEEWKECIVNDFETTVFEKFPQLAGYKEQLYRDGAIYASMSGSGSAMFGIWKK